MSSSPVSHRKPLPTGYGDQNEEYGLGLMEASPPQRNTPPQPTHRRIASNASSLSSFPISDAQATQAAHQFTTGKSLLEGYRSDIANNFEGERPRFNPLNTARTNSSMLLNMADPIQMHLLVETALNDAKEYEILSHEEVDELKKLCRSLEQRIGQTRQNLAIQSKYRDAAVNMAKLYTSKEGEKKHRLSMGFNRNSHSEQLREADMERHTSERRCEELAHELWSLEKRLIEPQTRLLKHTAGVLQLTHKGPRKGHATKQSQQGIPGSPESMFTYSNFRNSMEPSHGEDLFDERHHYRTFEGLDNFDLDGNRRSQKPGAKKDTDMDNEEYLKLKEETMKSAERIASTEAKLDELSNRLREVIIRVTPQRGEAYSRPPHIYAEDADSGNLLDSQLQYLEQSINIIDEEQDLTLQRQEESDATMEQTIGELNREVRSLLLPFNSCIEEPPQLTGRNLQEQLLYFQSTINIVEDELQRAASNASELTAELQRAKSTRTLDMVPTDSPANIQTVLEGLWDVIQSGEQDEVRRKKQRRQTQLDNGQELDDEDDDIDMPLERFSVPAFSAKVQQLYGQATRLKDQKEVLQRQIKQQRELNNKTDATRDAETAALEEELSSTRKLLERSQDQADELQAELSSVIAQLSKTESESATWAENKEKLLEEAAELRDVLFDRNEEIDGLKEQLAEVKKHGGKDTDETKSKLEQIQKQIVISSDRVVELEVALKKAEARIKDLMDELDQAHNTTRGSSKVLAETEQRIDELSAELKEAMKGEAEMLQTIAALKEKEDMLEQLLKSLAEHEQAVDNLHAALDEKELELVAMTKSHNDNNIEVEKLSAALATKEVNMERLARSLKEKENELEETTMELASLRTEVTIARAELEGAYGTRAERAADIAANPLVQKEIDDLLQSNIKLQEEIQATKAGGGQKVEELRKELREAMEEYEAMTKAGIEWERERENMERGIDKLREEREGLESRLIEERVRWLGVQSPGPGTPGSQRGGEGRDRVGAGSTSTSVLKNEFKKMMRDTRAESARMLRAEQTERRRLEEELRTLKKAQGPGRSMLSQSIVSTPNERE